MTYTNVDGKLINSAEAMLPADNGAFRYCHGIFETMLVQDGQICLKQYHWERLFSGLSMLHLALPVLIDADKLEEEVMRTVKKNQQERLCRVRLQVYAGGGGLYGSDNTAHFVIECFPLQPETLKLNENGLVAGRAQGLAKSPDSLANLKSCNALIYAIAARQAKENHWNDALIRNTHGNIIESTIANIFWVKNGSLYTPPLSEGCIAGVMRRSLMAQHPVTEQCLTYHTLMDADEVFLTNAIKRIRWVSTIEEKTYKCDLAKRI